MDDENNLKLLKAIIEIFEIYTNV